MSLSWFLQCYLFITLCSLNIVRSVPPDFCLSPLNQSDCHRPPTSVFSYYKPGSRCEIHTWRGCPTLNKFENEYLCSLHCLFRTKIEISRTHDCDIPLNEDVCSGERKVVYTHVNGTCIEGVFKGCYSPNMFNLKHECEDYCMNSTATPFVLEKELEKLDSRPLEILDKILQEVIEEETTTEAKTEAATEAATEAVTEAETEELTEAVTEAETEPPEETTEFIETTTNDDYEEVLNA